MDVGQSLTEYVEDHLSKSVKKYFDNALDSEVHFTKQGNLFKSVITVNEGVKGGITVKSDSEAGDVYASFDEACQKASKQLRRYKRKIINYRRQAGGLKSVEPDYKAFDAMKYVLPPSNDDFLDEMENEVEQENIANESLNVITEKTTNVEELSVNEAIMKMDLANLPALVFTNKDSKRINVVYHRKDGNISWIDPQNNQ